MRLNLIMNNKLAESSHAREPRKENCACVVFSLNMHRARSKYFIKRITLAGRRGGETAQRFSRKLDFYKHFGHAVRHGASAYYITIRCMSPRRIQ